MCHLNMLPEIVTDAEAKKYSQAMNATGGVRFVTAQDGMPKQEEKQIGEQQAGPCPDNDSADQRDD